VRPVIKRRDTQAIHCPAAPPGVIDGSRADVRFVAGLIIDKFCYHQPLYRQHQRLGDNGIRVSRLWLTQLTHAALALLESVFTAQLDSIRASRIKAMDETPIKAGRAGPGKMKGGYFWPVYGERGRRQLAWPACCLTEGCYSGVIVALGLFCGGGWRRVAAAAATASAPSVRVTSSLARFVRHAFTRRCRVRS
jgi:hypothetical protein